MRHLRRGYYGVASLTGIAIVLITLGIESYQYHNHKYLILRDLKNRLDEHALALSLRTQAVQEEVKGLQLAAEDSLRYIKHYHHTSFLFPLLKESPDQKSFSLDGGALPVNKSAVGNLVGLGSLKSLSSSEKEEINMALFLNTFFEVAFKNTPGAVGVNYISRNHFQLSYPWRALDPSTLDEFVNADQNSWTSPHHNVITNASPIYDGDRFLGIVSMDISLAELNRVLQQFQSSSGTLLLINKNQDVIASKGIKVSTSLLQLVPADVLGSMNEELKNPDNWFSFKGPSVIYAQKLQDTPWVLVYITSKDTLFSNTFYESVQDIVVISLILLVIVALGYFFVIRDFITPAEKLVDHIRKEQKGIESEPQNLPPQWHAWFHIVSHIFSENRRLLQDLEHRVQLRTQELEEKNKELETTLTALKKAKNRIIVQEKLASLGQLTAGIAHEIKNPLNFIINFIDLSLEYLSELKDHKENEDELLKLMKDNMKKAKVHAQRADAIVKTMLAHARGSEKEGKVFNLHKLLSEVIDLAYFSFKGEEESFNAHIIKNFDKTIETIEGFEQELARVFLNIINNACFSMNEKRVLLGASYQPELSIKTQNKGDKVKITIQDNGKGMSASVLKKIFTPFFTTKGAGKGTGLGLSLSHDIITHQHHGSLTVESKSGTYSRFIIELPKKL
jgi:signal transduction histidine kinase